MYHVYLRGSGGRVPCVHVQEEGLGVFHVWSVKCLVVVMDTVCVGEGGGRGGRGGRGVVVRLCVYVSVSTCEHARLFVIEK